MTTSAPTGRSGRPARLPDRRDFLRVQAGKRCAMPGFVLQIAPRPSDLPPSGTAGPRVGFTVSRKVGNAVERNRVRRRLRALAATALRRPLRCDLDYVLVGRKEALGRDFTALTAELEKALDRLGARLPATP